ncbi:transmembrane protein 207 isoform X2 [Marmota monax]|uniref:transmembrane protein 207 isoform X2 n=1 Tax=Marmota monax TaxID=9995 RepID=UPI001EB051FB|nr:transmembrane protein 207 isoform X2 [Marmota monax]
MSGFRSFSVASVISTGTWCLSLFQLVLSNLPCEENEMCLNYTDQHPNDWYIWFLLLIFLVSLLCGVVLFCLQCWLKRSRMDSPRRTMAVFAVGDLDSICENRDPGVPAVIKCECSDPERGRRLERGTEAAVSPTLGIHLQTQNLEQYPVPCFDTLGPPPPYEETPKTQGCF